MMRSGNETTKQFLARWQNQAKITLGNADQGNIDTKIPLLINTFLYPKKDTSLSQEVKVNLLNEFIAFFTPKSSIVASGSTLNASGQHEIHSSVFDSAMPVSSSTISVSNSFSTVVGAEQALTELYGNFEKTLQRKDISLVNLFLASNFESSINLGTIKLVGKKSIDDLIESINNFIKIQSLNLTLSDVHRLNLIKGKLSEIRQVSQMFDQNQQAEKTPSTPTGDKRRKRKETSEAALANSSYLNSVRPLYDWAHLWVSKNNRPEYKPTTGNSEENQKQLKEYISGILIGFLRTPTNEQTSVQNKTDALRSFMQHVASIKNLLPDLRKIYSAYLKEKNLTMLSVCINGGLIEDRKELQESISKYLREEVSSITAEANESAKDRMVVLIEFRKALIEQKIYDGVESSIELMDLITKTITAATFTDSEADIKKLKNLQGMVAFLVANRYIADEFLVINKAIEVKKPRNKSELFDLSESIGVTSSIFRKPKLVKSKSVNSSSTAVTNRLTSNAISLGRTSSTDSNKKETTSDSIEMVVNENEESNTVIDNTNMISEQTSNENVPVKITVALEEIYNAVDAYNEAAKKHDLHRRGEALDKILEEIEELGKICMHSRIALEGNDRTKLEEKLEKIGEELSEVVTVKWVPVPVSQQKPGSKKKEYTKNQISHDSYLDAADVAAKYQEAYLLICSNRKVGKFIDSELHKITRTTKILEFEQFDKNDSHYRVDQLNLDSKLREIFLKLERDITSKTGPSIEINSIQAALQTACYALNKEYGNAIFYSERNEKVTRLMRNLSNLNRSLNKLKDPNRLGNYFKVIPSAPNTVDKNETTSSSVDNSELELRSKREQEVAQARADKAPESPVTSSLSNVPTQPRSILDISSTQSESFDAELNMRVINDAKEKIKSNLENLQESESNQNILKQLQIIKDADESAIAETEVMINDSIRQGASAFLEIGRNRDAKQLERLVDLANILKENGYRITNIKLAGDINARYQEALNEFDRSRRKLSNEDREFLYGFIIFETVSNQISATPNNKAIADKMMLIIMLFSNGIMQAKLRSGNLDSLLRNAFNNQLDKLIKSGISEIIQICIKQNVPVEKMRILKIKQELDQQLAIKNTPQEIKDAIANKLTNVTEIIERFLTPKQIVNLLNDISTMINISFKDNVEKVLSIVKDIIHNSLDDKNNTYTLINQHSGLYIALKRVFHQLDLNSLSNKTENEIIEIIYIRNIYQQIYLHLYPHNEKSFVQTEIQKIKEYQKNNQGKLKQRITDILNEVKTELELLSQGNVIKTSNTTIQVDNMGLEGSFTSSSATSSSQSVPVVSPIISSIPHHSDEKEKDKEESSLQVSAIKSDAYNALKSIRESFEDDEEIYDVFFPVTQIEENSDTSQIKAKLNIITRELIELGRQETDQEKSILIRTGIHNLMQGRALAHLISDKTKQMYAAVNPYKTSSKTDHVVDLQHTKNETDKPVSSVEVIKDLIKGQAPVANVIPEQSPTLAYHAHTFTEPKTQVTLDEKTMQLKDFAIGSFKKMMAVNSTLDPIKRKSKAANDSLIDMIENFQLGLQNSQSRNELYHVVNAFIRELENIEQTGEIGEILDASEIKSYIQALRNGMYKHEVTPDIENVIERITQQDRLDKSKINTIVGNLKKLIDIEEERDDPVVLFTLTIKAFQDVLESVAQTNADTLVQNESLKEQPNQMKLESIAAIQQQRQDFHQEISEEKLKFEIIKESLEKQIITAQDTLTKLKSKTIRASKKRSQLETQEQELEAKIKKANTKLSTLKRQRTEQEIIMDNAVKQTTQFVTDAKADADRKAKEIIAAARVQANAILQAANEKIEEETARATKSLVKQAKSEQAVREENFVLQNQNAALKADIEELKAKQKSALSHLSTFAEKHNDFQLSDVMQTSLINDLSYLSAKLKNRDPETSESKFVSESIYALREFISKSNNTKLLRAEFKKLTSKISELANCLKDTLDEQITSVVHSLRVVVSNDENYIDTSTPIFDTLIDAEDTYINQAKSLENAIVLINAINDFVDSIENKRIFEPVTLDENVKELEDRVAKNAKLLQKMIAGLTYLVVAHDKLKKMASRLSRPAVFHKPETVIKIDRNKY